MVEFEAGGAGGIRTLYLPDNIGTLSLNNKRPSRFVGMALVFFFGGAEVSIGRTLKDFNFTFAPSI